MADYRLSRRAARDVRDIYDFTEKAFGRYQAEAYHSGLERVFGLLADFPEIGRSAEEIVPDFRRFRFQSHVNFYSLDGRDLVIRALIHARMNVRPALFE